MQRACKRYLAVRLAVRSSAADSRSSAYMVGDRPGYTKLLQDARQEATDRLAQAASVRL